MCVPYQRIKSLNLRYCGEHDPVQSCQISFSLSLDYKTAFSVNGYGTPKPLSKNAPIDFLVCFIGGVLYVMFVESGIHSAGHIAKLLQTSAGKEVSENLLLIELSLVCHLLKLLQGSDVPGITEKVCEGRILREY